MNNLATEIVENNRAIDNAYDRTVNWIRANRDKPDVIYKKVNNRLVLNPLLLRGFNNVVDHVEKMPLDNIVVFASKFSQLWVLFALDDDLTKRVGDLFMKAEPIISSPLNRLAMRLYNGFYDGYPVKVPNGMIKDLPPNFVMDRKYSDLEKVY